MLAATRFGRFERSILAARTDVEVMSSFLEGAIGTVPSQDGERSSRGDKSMEVVWVGPHDASPQASSGRLSGSGRVCSTCRRFRKGFVGATSWLTQGKASIRVHRSRRVAMNRNAGARRVFREAKSPEHDTNSQGCRWRQRIWQL